MLAKLGGPDVPNSQRFSCPTSPPMGRPALPGDGINGVFGALNRAEAKIQFVQARHEEMAAFMASAYAKFSGKLGVCIANLRAGHVASDHRSLRCAAGSSTGPCHCRPAGTKRAWWTVSAGTGSGLDVQGCSERLCPASLLSRPGTAPARSRGADRSPAGFVVKNRLNIFSFISAGIPVPLSRCGFLPCYPDFLWRH
jgi:hypothetical protein